MTPPICACGDGSAFRGTEAAATSPLFDFRDDVPAGSRIARSVPSPAKQVNRRYAAVPLAGSALFGAVLGVGLLTLITTPLVWAGAVAVLATGSAAAGVLYGIGFALGRTLQLVQQRLIRPSRHGDIAVRVAKRSRGYHPAGAAVATCLIALAAIARL